MELSTNTIITLGTILLVVCILGVARQAVSTIMMTLGICIIVVVIIQSTSDVVLIDFTNLVEVIIHWVLRLFQWAKEIFWPALTDVARDIENNL